MQCNVECRLPEEDVILKEPPLESPPSEGARIYCIFFRGARIYCIFFYKFSKKVNNATATYRVGKKGLTTHLFCMVHVL